MNTPKTIIYHIAGNRNKGSLDIIQEYWIVAIVATKLHTDIKYIQAGGTVGERYRYYTKEEAQIAEKLFHLRNTEKESKTEISAESYQDFGSEPTENAKNPMQKFESGATRTGDTEKLNYVKALSPIVLERYVQYLNAHRKQADGIMRDFDNWKKGIPTDRYLEGLGRHFIAVWLLGDGFPAEDDKGPVTLEDTLCAIIFGASGWLHEIIKDKRKGKTLESIVTCASRVPMTKACENCINFEKCTVERKQNV